MSFEISELMVQLSEAKEKPSTVCQPGSTTKVPDICQPGSTTKAQPTICQPGSTTKEQPGVKPLVCETGSTTKAQLDERVSASDELDAVLAQMRETLATV